MAARRIPLTAKEQLLLARDAGHELSVSKHVNPDHLDAPPKWRIYCTCGYESNARRSLKAVNASMALHLSRVIANEIMPDDRNGGSGAASGASPAPAARPAASSQ